MAAYIHYGSAKHRPMLTVKAEGTLGDVRRDVQKAIKEGTPVSVQLEDVVFTGREFLRKFKTWTTTRSNGRHR